MYICKHDFYTCITLQQPVFQRTNFFKGYTAQEKLNGFTSQTTFRSKSENIMKGREQLYNCINSTLMIFKDKQKYKNTLY